MSLPEGSLTSPLTGWSAIAGMVKRNKAATIKTIRIIVESLRLGTDKESVRAYHTTLGIGYGFLTASAQEIKDATTP